MGAWYTIGLCLGLGLGIGVVLSGLLGVNGVGVGIAAVLAALAGAGVGMLIGDLAETVAGAIAGVLGALSGATVVRGAMGRGATRIGVAAFVGAGGLLTCLLALVPVVGYALVVALPIGAVRMRGRRAERYAGLRTLAK
jgi:hypothetical protein